MNKSKPFLGRCGKYILGNKDYNIFRYEYDDDVHFQQEEGGSSLIAQWVKNLPERQETRIRFLSQKDTLEKEMATHSSILAWKIPWIEEPDRL